MLNVLLIIGATALVFIGYYLFGYLITMLLTKCLKLKDNEVQKTPFYMSCLFLLVLLSVYIAAISSVSSIKSLSNLEFYFVFSLIGIFSIFWCYFEINNEGNVKDWKCFIRALVPKLASKKVLAQKKALVFGIVFLFSFYFGYKQVLKNLNVIPEDVVYSIINTTMVTIMIALDRLLNQIHTLFYKEPKVIVYVK